MHSDAHWSRYVACQQGTSIIFPTSVLIPSGSQAIIRSESGSYVHTMARTLVALCRPSTELPASSSLPPSRSFYSSPIPTRETCSSLVGALDPTVSVTVTAESEPPAFPTRNSDTPFLCWHERTLFDLSGNGIQLKSIRGTCSHHNA
jgi:hypothetical protein